ncbi:MAG: hypothetical protein GY939_21865, partial [Actinomycetia bacterium]|nr:hypothetical protein [Actinomycetes bacterium]
MTNGRRSSSLRTQLLTRTLLAGLVPLVVLAVVAVFGLVKLNNTADEVATSRHQLAEESATARMSSEATSAGREIGQALDAYIDQLATLASESAVVAAASDGTPAAVSLLIELAETEPAIT